MTCTRIEITSDVCFLCLSHAFSTEKEEIMGLLIGEIDPDSHVATASSSYMLTRSDKRRDRVEISPEQLSEAAMHAEKLSRDLKREMRIVGWYHSHPHITVWPSHVDVRTQASYQLMDEDFVGVIFSVFNQEKTNQMFSVEMIAFQSIDTSPEGQPPQYKRHDIPIKVLPSLSVPDFNMDNLSKLAGILVSEEEDIFKNYRNIDRISDLITAIHNSAVFSTSMCHILDVLVDPLLQSLEDRAKRNQEEKLKLNAEREALEQTLSDLIAQESKEEETQMQTDADQEESLMQFE